MLGLIEAVDIDGHLCIDGGVLDNYPALAIASQCDMSRVFPAFFFFIAILVSLTTMTRLVDERRSETGTLKALGFSNWQLLSEYLAYAFLATLLGSFAGLEIGFKLFPRVISKAYGMMYIIPPVETPFRWNIALVSGGIAMVGILLATLWACLSETGAVPAVLMNPSIPYSVMDGWIMPLGQAETQAWQAVQFSFRWILESPPGGTMPTGIAAPLSKPSGTTPESFSSAGPFTFDISDAAEAATTPAARPMSICLRPMSSGSSF